MFILVSGATKTVQHMMIKHPTLGVLLTPNAGNAAPEQGVVWAADNSAFSGFDDCKFRKFLDRIAGRTDCRFVACPDVVGDHERTLERWQTYRPLISERQLTPAFVAQDGCLVDDVPWVETGSVFIGGTTRYKLGEAAAQIIGACNKRNLWSHMGRVNTAKRVLYAAALDCRSVDGSSFSRFASTHLPWALRLACQIPLRLHVEPL